MGLDTFYMHLLLLVSAVIKPRTCHIGYTPITWYSAVCVMAIG